MLRHVFTGKPMPCPAVSWAFSIIICKLNLDRSAVQFVWKMDLKLKPLIVRLQALQKLLAQAGMLKMFRDKSC